jgi:hypothetical protein
MANQPGRGRRGKHGQRRPVDPDVVQPDAEPQPRRRGGGNPPPAPGDPADHAPEDMGTIAPPVAAAGFDAVGYNVDQGRRALAELLRRNQEALKLYVPLAEQDRFHRSQAPSRIVIGGNRGGKTTPAAVEVARAVTGQDPYGKWPREDANFIIVGKDGNHVGKVLYPRLFLRRRNFLIIRDQQTGLWRAWRPWDEGDVARKAEARTAPPLIPPRFVQEESWYSKKDRIPRVVRLVNGWELYFYSSEADPPQGYPADGAWIDEEIQRGQEWVEEIQARLLDRQGRLIWSAAPQHATEELYDMHLQAQDQREGVAPQVEEFRVHIDQNVYLPAEAKEQFKARMRRRGESVYAVRVEGQFAIEGFKVYPEYGDHHRIKRFNIPDEWTVYAVIDPGRQVCAVLFVACPPPTDPRWGGRVIFCDELYLKEADARKFAKGMSDKLRGRLCRSFMIDKHESRKHDTGSGRTVEAQYSKALRQRKLMSYATRYSFDAAPDNPEGNREAMREWLCPDDDGRVRLAVFDDLENFDREMRNYHFKRDPQTHLPTDQVVKKDDHLCDCAGYAAGANLGWKKPPAVKSIHERDVLKLLAQRRRRRARAQGSRNYVNIGPGGQ